MEEAHISKLPSALDPNNGALYPNKSPQGRHENLVSHYQTAVSNSKTELRDIEVENHLGSFDNLNTINKTDSKRSSPIMQLK